MSEYHFGVSGEMVWMGHIVLGLYFLYLGYLLTKKQDVLYHGVTLIVFGVMMASYHSHLWFYEMSGKA